jgi:hypothetical protein
MDPNSVNKETATQKDRKNYWSNHIEQFKSSKQSLTDYCREHQLKRSKFHYWKHKLANENSKKKRQFIRAIQIPEMSESHMSLNLGQGIRLEFSKEPDVKWVQELIRELRSQEL